MKKNTQLQKGVTLIELLVVIGIFAVVSTVLLFNYSDFNTGVSLRGLTQDMALSVRKAQSYATSVQNVVAINTGSATYPAYGISVSTDAATGNTTIPSQKNFILFADISGSGNANIYDAGSSCGGSVGGGNECIDSYGISTADRIVQICTDVTGCSATRVDITFRRPSPDAHFCVVSGASCLPQMPSYVKIVLESPKGLQRAVSIWNTGQISIQ